MFTTDKTSAVRWMAFVPFGTNGGGGNGLLVSLSGQHTSGNQMPTYTNATNNDIVSPSAYGAQNEACEHDELLEASRSGNFSKVDFILKNCSGIDINKEDLIGLTSLMYASRHGHSDITKLLLEEDGIEINKTDEFGRTALHWATRKGNIDIVQLLLDQQEIDITITDKNGNTALVQATHDGNLDIARLLFEAG